MPSKLVIQGLIRCIGLPAVRAELSSEIHWCIPFGQNQRTAALLQFWSPIGLWWEVCHVLRAPFQTPIMSTALLSLGSTISRTCKIATIPMSNGPAMDLAVSSTATMRYFNPQLFFIHGATDDEVSEITLNLGTWSSVCAPGDLCAVSGPLPSVAIPNEAATGTTINTLAKLTGAPSTAIIAATTDTGGMIGIVIERPG